MAKSSSRALKRKTVPKGEATNTEGMDLSASFGRGLRKSAGRKSLPDGFVESNSAIKKATAEADDDFSSSEDEARTRSRKKQRLSLIKHRSPPPDPVSPRLDHQDAESGRSSSPLGDLEKLDDLDISPPSRSNISLTFNVPKNHAGAFVVNLDLKSLLDGNNSMDSGYDTEGTYFSAHSDEASSSSDGYNTLSTSCNQAQKPHLAQNNTTGFLDLPFELRDTIYKLAFSSKGAVEFNRPITFSRSSQLLRTCKQVLHEGRIELYSKNTFQFHRNGDKRGAYWQHPWPEIGYKDVRRFLEGIGSQNLSLLRDVSFMLTDGLPSHCHTFDEYKLRAVHDNQLIASVDALAYHGRLRNLSLTFNKTRQIKMTDERFLRHLRRVKVDTLEIDDSTWYNQRRRIDYQVKDWLRAKMIRSEKLYLKTEDDKRK